MSDVDSATLRKRAESVSNRVGARVTTVEGNIPLIMRSGMRIRISKVVLLSHPIHEAGDYGYDGHNLWAHALNGASIDCF